MARFNTQGWDLQTAPEHGGVITICQYDGLDILRPATPHWFKTNDPTESAYFPLVPFSNRIDGGHFQFGGRNITLPKNAASEPHALHGTGWQAAWRVYDHAASHITLAYEHAKGKWPWAYEAKQMFAVRGSSLTLSLSITNKSASPMPAGLGFHPYFPRTKSTVLTFNAKTVWMPKQETNLFPQINKPIPLNWDFSKGRTPGTETIDHCFSGWEGHANIDGRIHITSDKVLRHAVLYTPKGEDYFCFEPVTHINNAVNALGPPSRTGLRIIEAGETLAVSMRINVLPRS